MMSILRKTTASMAANRSRSTPVVEYDVVCDDLSAWEIVGDCLSDDDVYSFDGDVSISDEPESEMEEEDGGACDSEPSDEVTSVMTDGDGVISDAPESEIESEEEDGACVTRDSGTPVSPISAPEPAEEESACVSRDSGPPVSVPSLLSLFVPRRPYDHGYDDSSLCEEDVHYDEEEEEEAYDDDDVDDELVPWKFKDRFGKQRIKKMGKRGGPKVNKSKRLPYYHNRPGCLYGKHGLGVQHAYL